MRLLNQFSRPFQTRIAPAGARRWTSLLAVGVMAAAIVTARAQSLYWDANDATVGAGTTPAGTWGTDLFWTLDPNGEAVTVGWTNGSTAVFSAGADASGAFIVTVSGIQTAGALNIEEGAVTLAGGTVALGTGSITIGPSATLSTDSSLRVSAAAGSVMTINGGTARSSNPSTAGSFVDVDQVIVLGTGGGTLSYSVAGLLNIVQTTTTISGTGPLRKEGAGILAIASPCTYSGATIINDGTLRVRYTAPATTNRLPAGTDVIINSPGVLDPGSSSDTIQQVNTVNGNGNITYSASSTLLIAGDTDSTISGVISDGTAFGRISKRGAGTLTLSGANTYDGRFTNDAGTTTITSGATWCGPACDTYVNGGTVNLNNASQTILSIAGAGGTVNLGSGHTLTVNNGSTKVFAGTFAGPGALTKTGTGILALGGNNTYEGNTMVGAGRLQVNSATALGTTAGHTEVASGAELLFDGAASTFTIDEPLRIAGPGGSENGAIAVQNSANITIGGPVTLVGDTTNTVSGTGTVLYNNPNAITSAANESLWLQGGGLSTGNGGTISGVISLGTGGLTKQQGGRWTLSGANVYSGPTLVSAGTLRVANTTGSATGSGDVTVNAGASLSGPGSIAGALILNGTIAPGASPGTMNTGSETWNGGASYVWEINDVDAGAGTDPGWDLANINGTLTINATPGSKFNIDVRSLTLANAAGDVHDFNNGLDYAWTIVHTTGGITGFDPAAINVITSGFSNPRGLGFFTVELANGGNDLQIRFNHALGIASQPSNQSAECLTGSATFSVVASGVGPFAYQWRHEGVDIGGETAATLTVSPTTSATAGNYDVVVTNSFGSITSAVATLTLIDTVPPIITSCAPSETLSANASCQAPIPDLTGAVVASDTCSAVTRSQSPTAGTLVGPGVHTVTITILDAANNQTNCQTTVTVNDTTPPVITACPNNQTNIATLASCQSAIPDLTLQVVSTDNCLGPVTVTQSPIAGTLVGVGDHIVTLTATDAANNSTNCQTTVTVVSGVTVTVNSPTICPGGSTTLTATTAAASPTYLWSPGGAMTASISVSPSETTVYTVTVTDGITGCTGSGSGTVTIGSALAVTVNSATICPGDSVLLTATSDATSPTYLWSPGGETTASITVSPSTTTAYSVTVMDNAGCTGNGSGTVTVKQPAVFANNNAIAINDNNAASPYPSTISVSGQTATVCRVTVTLNNLSHPFPDDIDIVLVGPNGEGVLLMSDVGNADALSGVTLTLDDSAAASLPDAGAIAGGIYKPTNYGSKDDGRPDNFPAPAPVARFGTNLSGFSGINPNGTWSLYVVDDEAVDAGSIAGGWSIAITTLTPFADVSVAQASIPNPVAVGSNLTLAVTISNNGPADAANISLADTLPAGVTFVSATPSQGSCTPGAGTVSCSLGTILAGGSATVNIIVVPSANSIITNSATVTSSTLDFVTANNTSSTSVTVLDPPVITVQPLAQTVCADHAVALSVTATGSAPLTYQWYKDAVAIDGATASTFSIPGAQPGDSGNYTVVVANSVGAEGSAVALVTVHPLPTVAVNSETICLGASATLNATTSAANPSYLWSPGGATTPSITVSPASTTIYTVLVTDGVTGCTNSASGTVTVNPLTTASAIQSYSNLCPGSPVSFSTVAGGTPPFTYEWRKDEVTIAGQTADTLSIPSVAAADAGTYSVVVTGTCGAVTNSGTLTLAAPPTITAQPQNQTTPMGNGAVFTVAASSAVASNIQWQLNGVDIPGATSTSLAVSNVTLSQNGEAYRAVVSNCGGSTTSLAAILTVTPIAGVAFDFDTPGQFTNAPYALNFNDWLSSSFNTPPTVFESPIGGVGPAWGGGSLDLIPNNGTVNSAILVPLSYDFSLPGKTLTAVAMVRIKNPTANARNTQIGFTVSTNADLDNGAGRVYMSALLQSTAQPAPTFEVRSGTKPTAANSFIEGSIAAGTAVGAGNLAVSNWYRFKATFSNNTANVANTYRLTTTLENMGIDGLGVPTVVATLNSILVTNANVVAAKTLYFVVRGQENCGVDFWDNFYAYASGGPVAFVRQPASQTTPQGRRVTFQALVDGEGPYTYQWSKNGSPIDGARNWKYVIPPALIGDNGAQYTVTVTGPANSVTSDPATLSVTADPLAVVSAGSVDGTTVGIKFNQPVNVASAENPANYSINGTAPANARVFRTSLSPLGPEGIYVVLTPSSVVSGSFTVTVSGVTDLSGGAIGAANSAAGSVAGLTGYDVNPLAIGPQGEDYSFGPGQFHVMGGGADIFGVADQFRYVYTQKTGDFDVKVRVPYVDVVRNPTKAGFHVRESLSPFSPNVMAYVVPMWPGRNQPEGTARATYNSATVSWGANPTYNLSWFPDAWVRFRRVGNTFHRYSSTNGVNWNYDGQASGAVPATVYFGLAVCAVANNNECRAQFEEYGDFGGYPGATITILTQPTNTTVAAGSAVSINNLMAAIAGAPAVGELTYVWQREDGVGGWTNLLTAGATNNTVSTGVLLATDNGAMYRAILMAPGALSVTSSVATVTVTDTAAPTLTSANGAVLPSYPVSEVLLNFSEALSLATATDLANYTVTNAAGVRLTVLSATFLSGDPRTVVLKVDGQLGLGTASVGVSGIRDLNNNLLSPTVRTFRSFAPSTAPVVTEIFQDIGNVATPITNLTLHPFYLNDRPTFIVYSNLFGFNVSFAGIQDNYGLKAYTYFVPPTNGTYKFWLRSDDAAQIFMNTNAVGSTNAAGKVLIVENTAANANYSVGTTPASSVTNITLNANQPYYIEALLKEGTGGDGFSVMWTAPTVNTAPAATAFIPPANLAFPSAAAPPIRAVSEFYTGYTARQAGNGNIDMLVSATNYPGGDYIADSVAYNYIANTPPIYGYQKYFGVQPFNMAHTRFDNYLGRIISHFVAPSNGLYKFWMRSDDSSQLWMNTNAVNSTDPAGKMLLGRLNVFTANYNLMAQNVALTGGQSYYLEALWREGGGGDGVSVAVRPQSDSAIPPTSELIPGSMLELPLRFARAGAVDMVAVLPENPTVVDGREITLTAAGISGAPPYGTFWLRNGVRVMENSITNRTGPLTLSDNGAVYTLVVTNPFSRVERSVTLTVLPDGAAPTVVGISGWRYGDGFTIQFSDPMEAASATFLANYQVNNGLALLSATLDPTRTKVSVRTSAQAPNTTYTVTINGVRDDSSAHNAIAANTAVSFSTWAVGGSGFLVELFTNIVGSTIADLTSAPKFVANAPDVIYYTNIFGIGGNLANNTTVGQNSDLENYGARVTGYFVPASTGYYRFFIRSDDAAQLLMNINSTDSENPAGRTLLLHMPNAGVNVADPRSISPPVLLNQNQRYFTEALLKEGTGGDYLQVIVRPSDANGVLLGSMPVDNNTSENSTIFTFGGAGAPGDPNAITITQTPPGELSVKENDSVTLQLVAAIPISMARAVTYQWQKFDGVTYTNIPGARQSSLTFAAALTDDLRTIRLLFSAPGRVATYDTLLHVSPDNVGPRMVAAGSIDDGTHIGIEYSEQIHPDDAIDTFLYEVNGGASTVLFSEARPDGKSVVLTVSPPVTGTFRVVASGVTDRSAAGIDGDSEIEGKVYGFVPIDVGAPTAIGSSFGVRDGEIDVIAGGADVWGASDQGHFTLTPRYGDFDIWTRVQSLSVSDPISKAGLMVRESTNANSRVVHIQVNPPYQLGGRDLGEAAQRANTGAGTAIMPGFLAYTPVGIPYAWLRMKREGDTYTAFRSSDGSNWIVAGRTTLVMPDQVLIGLTTCAHNNAAPATLAEYRNVHIPNTPTILVQPAPASQTVPAHGTVTYSVVASNPPNSGPLTYQWRKDGLKIAGATSSSLTINDVQVSAAGDYTVWVGNDGGATISATATLIVGNGVPVAAADTVNTTTDVPVSTPASVLLANDSDPENEQLSLIAVSGLAPVSYVSDFNSGLPAGAALFGNATAELSGGVNGSGYIRINPSVTSQAGSLVLDELTPRRRVASFTASFKLRIAEGSAQPADGFSFNFAPDIIIGTSGGAENGVGTGLSLCFDNYQFAPYPNGGTANTSGIKLRFGGGDIAGVQTVTFDKDAFIPVTVSLDINGRVTVFVNGTNVFGNNIVVPWTPRPGRFGFYGRTGGERESHAIDDLSITTVLTVETERQANLNASIFGSAYIDGGFLHLNDAAGSVAGSFILNELTPGVPITSFTASFKLRIGNASSEPADGFSFNFADDLPISASTPAAAENGGGTGFSFCVDNYRFDPFPGGGTANTSGMKIRLGGVDIAGVRMPTWNTAAFIPVSITIASDGALTVLVDGTNVFGNMILPVSPSVGRFGLYARTGGQFQTHWVDDLNVSVTTAGAPASYSANFNSGGFGTVALNNGIVTYSPPAGACGTDKYYYLVSDPSGGVSVGTVTVNIDSGAPQPPVITACAAPRTVQVGADCMAALPDLTSALFVDDCAAFVVQQSPAAGTLVGIGTTSVTLTVSNGFGLTATCQTTVTVVDTTPPQVVSCPAPALLSADAACIATMPDLRPQFSAVDNCPVTVSQTPAPGTVLALGLTAVTLTATDSNGNSTNCLTAVTVQDITPPAIVCPANQTAACTNSAGTVVNFTATATDNCTALVPVVCTPASGSVFAIGVTTVTCVATDGANNTNSCNFTVTVSDSPQPTMTIVKQPGGVLIRWPQTCTPYILEETSNLGGTPIIWTPVGAPVVPVNGNNEVTISPADGNKFYRLSKQ